jgi:DNA-binding NarL/FixJ family response regulator
MSQGSNEGDPKPGQVWLFVLGEVPERWRDRARYASFIPLLPDEAASVLAAGAGSPVDPEEDALLRLAARGLPAPAIARVSGVSIRTVHRRLARLREQLEVDTTSELAAELSRMGFGE